MRADVPELLFQSRADFRAWLKGNAETSNGVWLVFGKNKSIVTLSANDALEEALCFGWIDGQMQKVDETKYLKYFARRRARSPWSDKNKKTIDELRAKGMMTESGENAVENAKSNGMWSAKHELITEEKVEALAERLSGVSPAAYERFMNTPPSARRTLTRRYLSFKSEEARQRDFLKIVELLINQ
ncbi:MAG: YdeI/OmpD-associated family protein [Clostridia bacterium]|nr:YdeI/OmpD-associated family protein [Clostridia bacterium]